MNQSINAPPETSASSDENVQNPTEAGRTEKHQFRYK